MKLNKEARDIILISDTIEQLNRLTGYDIPTLVETLQNANLFDKEMAKKILKYLRNII